MCREDSLLVCFENSTFAKRSLCAHFCVYSRSKASIWLGLLLNITINCVYVIQKQTKVNTTSLKSCDTEYTYSMQCWNENKASFRGARTISTLDQFLFSSRYLIPSPRQVSEMQLGSRNTSVYTSFCHAWLFSSIVKNNILILGAFYFFTFMFTYIYTVVYTRISIDTFRSLAISS